MSKTSKIKPLSDYLLVEPAEKETTLPSGLILPEDSQEKPREGKVISAGPGRRDESGDRVPMEVKVGDVVMYKKWGGTEVKVDGKELLLVKEEDVIALVEA